MFHNRIRFIILQKGFNITFHLANWLDKPLRYPPYNGKLKWQKN